MNFLLILLALLISGVAVLSVVALSGERAVPGAAFFSGVGRDGLGTFDRVEDFGFIAPLVGAPEDDKALENAPAAESAASTAESADANAVAAEPVRRGAVPLADDAESTLSAHDFVEKRKNPQAEGVPSAAEGS
ncbi:MAG: taurine ABC transporter substrate-binding protein [Rothia mucilaginosa]|uniref:taurine ABC transporter substrate-binding protein n=1 Tax=Rothia mucilaginosa TaxID=43675 RepID=UPI0026E9CFB1|nr:taurine ABC transporter substrate-binding protein [Rothia mucilaginosa]MBS5101428.1 taurine ABC transporter substrate-binding protein [Rothia mucilaginosa]